MIEHTGFEFDRAEKIVVTPPPASDALHRMRTVIAPELADIYPQFVERVFGFTQPMADAPRPTK